MHMNDPSDEGVDPVGELERLRAQADAGEIDLATVRAIRLGYALSGARAQGARELAALEAEVLSDLSVLRQARADTGGALALARAALALVPGHTTAAANLRDLEALPGAPPEDRSQEPLASMLNPWVSQALGLARREVGLEGKDVIEVGGAVPREHALATGARSWAGFYLGAGPQRGEHYEIRSADARAIPWPDASFDVAFSSCAFEHIQELPRALAEIRRCLRPGGVLVTAFAPIWSSAIGHHLWGELDDGRRVHFLDPIVPLFGHLLLDENELEWFLTHTVGANAARRFTPFVYRHPHINRLFEAEYHDAFAAAGFDDSRVRDQYAWNPFHVPSRALLAELDARHPGMGSFATPGLEGVLVPGARSAGKRRGRTIFIGVQP